MIVTLISLDLEYDMILTNGLEGIKIPIKADITYEPTIVSL